MSGGWEDEATFTWLERAAALSDANGPVQRVSLKDLVNRNPDWQNRQAEAWDQLTKGVIPFLAFGKTLNRSLAEVSLLPALANQNTTDPRARTVIYAYSGARQTNTGLPQSAAIDPIALLDLELLDLLNRFCNAVTKVVIPHGTLAWLFEEAQRFRVSQPSRVVDAHELRDLLSSRVIQRVETTTAIDEDLAREVGRDLASLFAEAEADWGSDKRPRYVIRPQPIHRLASLMEEEAELGGHATRLRGCLDVVDALSKRGRLTQALERRARAFLQLHERRLAVLPPIANNAVLYVEGDRYFNQHATVTHDGIARPIRTSFDVITALDLTEEERAERIALLRSAGFAFVPVTNAEIVRLMALATVSDGRVVETAELRLLRENLQMCRMTSGLQLPSESAWFDGLVRSLLEALRAQWTDGVDLGVARARSDWLLVSLDLRGWAHRSPIGTAPGFSQSRFRAQLLALSMFTTDVAEEVREAYWTWLNEALLGAVEDQHEGVFRDLTGDAVAVITGIVDRHRTDRSDVN